eukprot:TRINITY_DN3601_c0_g1_i1.p1 TRINITY_DN3601_c0_g1~~TRINITY_DN3601_c0_g1_i1.p1  ORF type:complete len:232 (-),score=62.35 TRINITY_DN3601_c0_g1_i1:12-707(-)
MVLVYWYIFIFNLIKDEGKKDVFDLSLEDGFYDFNGFCSQIETHLSAWDISKTLKMMRESNCSVFEWLYSPIVYRCNLSFLEDAKSLMEKNISKKSITFHFYNKAMKHLKDYFGERWGDEVLIKKYFYVIRPLLCIQWIKEHENENPFPPAPLIDLLDQVTIEENHREAFLELVRRKKEEPDFSKGKRITILDDWIANLLKSGFEYAKSLPVSPVPETDEYNDIFAKYVLE